MAVSAQYVASQNKRWQDANKSNDTDLMSRLQADAKRANYTLDPYQAAVNNVRNTVSPAPAAPAATTPVSRANQTLTDIRNQTDQGYQFKAPVPFTYNQDDDPAYQAALASARQNITQQQADTNARLRAGGQGKSSWSDTVANQIGAKEMAKVSTDVLPQLISQAYQRYADGANRDLAVQQANYGVGQDRISNLAQLYSLQNNEDFNNPMAEAQLTGQYLPGEARQYINAINNLKAQAETRGITADERNVLSQQADAYRAALQGLGIDQSLFGADVNRSTSMQNANQAGISTLAKQQMDYAQQADQRDFDRGVLESDRNFDFQKSQTEWENNFKQGQFDWQKAQQTWENAFKEKNFQQQMREAAASRGLQWASLNQRDKEFVADQAFREKQFEYQKQQDSIANNLASQRNQGAVQTAEDYAKYIDSSMFFNKDMFGNMVIPEGQMDNLERLILASNLPDNELIKLYARYGLPTR